MAHRQQMIVIVGVPGSGKTTILREVQRQIPTLNLINYGDKMLEIAAEQGLSRDSLRRLPIKEQQQIGVEAARSIKASGSAIIDTHALVKTPSGYVPGLPRSVLDILTPTAYVLIECKPSLILQRRQTDKGRERDQEVETELSIHQELTRSYIAACSMYTGSLLCHIRNDEDALQNTIRPLLQLLS